MSQYETLEALDEIVEKVKRGDGVATVAELREIQDRLSRLEEQIARLIAPDDSASRSRPSDKGPTSAQ